MAQEERSSSVIINQEALANSLKIDNGEKLSEDFGTTKCNNVNCISQVSKCIGENIYEPYHHEKRRLLDMNKRKLNSMQCMLRYNTKKTLSDYIESLRKVENIVRRYYDEEIKMESDEFLMMLLLDGSFILDATRVIDLTNENEDLGDFQERNFVAQDLSVVENQIPFPVLKIIYEVFNGEESAATPSLSDKIVQFVEQIFCHYPKAIEGTGRPKSFDHLLHLCHMYLRPSINNEFYSPQHGHDRQRMTFWRSVMQYHAAGVQFWKRDFNEKNPHSLLDVRFTNNILQIPYLKIEENTPILLKNLIALEQTTLNLGNDITAYTVFMSRLIQNTKDVTLLVSKGIIEHDLRSEEDVVDLFMWLSEGVVFDFRDRFYLKNICHNLEVSYQSRMKRWNMWFKRTTSAIF